MNLSCKLALNVLQVLPSPTPNSNKRKSEEMKGSAKKSEEMLKELNSKMSESLENFYTNEDIDNIPT